MLRPTASQRGRQAVLAYEIGRSRRQSVIADSREEKIHESPRVNSCRDVNIWRYGLDTD